MCENFKIATHGDDDLLYCGWNLSIKITTFLSIIMRMLRKPSIEYLLTREQQKLVSVNGEQISAILKHFVSARKVFS